MVCPHTGLAVVLHLEGFGRPGVDVGGIDGGAFAGLKLLQGLPGCPNEP